MNEGGFSLVLYCGGRTNQNINLCSGTRNILINFDMLLNVDTDKILDFIDFSCKLFDRPIYDWNKIMNIISILKERFNIIDDITWNGLYVWAPLHKRCNVWLRLVFNNELNIESNIKENNLLAQVKR